MLCRFGEWNLKDVDFLNTVQLITAKPVVYLVNLTEKAYTKKKSKWLPKVSHTIQLPACHLHAGPDRPTGSLPWMKKALLPRKPISH